MPVLDSDSELPRPADSDYAEHTPCLWSSLVVCVTQSKRAIVTAQSAAYSELRRSLFIHISFTVVNHVCLFIILWAAFTNCTNCTFPPLCLDIRRYHRFTISIRSLTIETQTEKELLVQSSRVVEAEIQDEGHYSQTKKSNNDVEPLLS